MNKILLLLAIVLFSFSSATAQGLENDNSVMYMKANVLFDSGRYDEAVRMYNRILREDENHTDALFMRSKAKYELGAFKGTKNDLLLYIEMVGINKAVIKVMAATEIELGNDAAALNYANTALEIDPYDSDMFLIKGDASLHLGDRNEACESYFMADGLDNAKAQRRMRSSCNGYRPKHDSRMPDTNRNTDTASSKVDEASKQDQQTDQKEQMEDKDDDGIVSLEDIVNDAKEERETDYNDNNNDTRSKQDQLEDRVNMNSTQTIEIDSKLDVVIAEGLGSRKLTSKPSIFMLSDQDGIVVINLCVDGNGKVTEAKFDRDNSTIFRSSITSLALRKSKEFVFEGSRRADQCGVLAFKIKA